MSAEGRTLDEMCRAVVEKANSRGGPDNATAVVVEVTEDAA
jgi:serine/threonine protein phosphatase PrpC